MSKLDDRDVPAGDEGDGPRPSADAGTAGSAAALPSSDPGEITSHPTWRASTFAALEVPTYRLLWLGGVLSFLSVQMQIVARAALAYDLTERNSALGAVMFGFGLPLLLLTPIGGVAADRFSKRGLILASQWLLIVSSLALALALVFDVIEFWMLVASAAIQAAAFAFLGPARMAFTGELVGRRLLGNAVILQQMSMNGTRVFGPAMAGVLTGIVWFGYEGVYFMTAAITAVASAMTFRLPPGRPPPDTVPGRPLAEFVGGIRYVRANPNLLLLLVVSLLVVMTAFPYISFLPTLSKDIFGFGDDNTGYGFMAAATAIGAVCASLLIAGRASGPQIWKLQAAAGTAFGLGLLALAGTPTFLLSLLVLVFVGGATSAFQALNNTMVLLGSESRYHGRMQSLMMLSFSGFGLMALPLGVVADAIGLRATYAAMGAVTATAMVVYYLVRPAVDRRYPMRSDLD